MNPAPVCIAIVGAESTGKTALARSLAQRLAGHTGLRCTWVPEYLREWCEAMARTPHAEEQRAIAEEQVRRIDEACTRFDVVIADTTALMTAVYSELLFADTSLYSMALAHQRSRFALTLLTAVDLPWVADGHMRDGEHVRGPVDSLVRRALLTSGVGWCVVTGQGSDRLEAAVDAVTPTLLRRPGVSRSGLFTRLQDRDAAQPEWTWTCDTCDDPDCEHAAMRGSQRT